MSAAHRRRRLVVVATSAALLAVACGSDDPIARGGAGSSTTTTIATSTSTDTVGRNEPAPPPSNEESPTPLGTPPPLPDGADQAVAGSAFQYLTTQPDGSGDPVAYDPCRPIHYVVNARTAPEGAEQSFLESIALVSQATGLQFVGDGSTDERPDLGRPLYQPDRYGDRWAPVLVAWSDQAELDFLTPDSFGNGGSYPVDSGDGREVYVTGQIVYNGPAIEADLATFPPAERPARLRAILMHYAAHIVGLTHTDDSRNILYHSHAGRATDWSVGDRVGLAAVGSGRCYPEI